MTRSALLALLALCVASAVAQGSGLRDGSTAPEEPPRDFPFASAEPFNKDKLRAANASGEAADMLRNASLALNETDAVVHPKVKDPGTTHEEDQNDSKGTIHACELPDPGSASSASDWLADSGHISKLAAICKLPSSLLNNGTTGTLRVCSIPKDVWDSTGYNVTSGTVSKVLLDKLNALNVTCVTPRSNSSNNGNDTITSGIPSASLLGKNNTIYIYIIPRDWLRRNKPSLGKASEVEDLTGNPVSAEPSTDAPTSNPSTQAPLPATGAPVSSKGNTTEVVTGVPSTTIAATTTANTTANTSIQVNSNPTVLVPVGPTNSSSSKANTTFAPTSSSDINSTVKKPTDESVTTIAPPGKSKMPNNTQTSTNMPPKKASNPAKTTDQSREETTKPSQSKETKKPFDKPAETITSTVMPVTMQPKSTDAPATSSTEKPKEEAAKPQEHSDTENEVAHNEFSAPSPAPLSQSHNDHAKADSSGKAGFLQPTESAAILAGVFVAIAVLGYAGLLLWRRVLEKRYGNREMLVNEDDDFDTSDMRHFEL